MSPFEFSSHAPDPSTLMGAVAVPSAPSSSYTLEDIVPAVGFNYGRLDELEEEVGS